LTQAWDRAWFVKAKSDKDKILISCDKLMKFGGLSRTGYSLTDQNEPL